MEVGQHVRLLVEGAVKPEEGAAITLHRLMVVILVVDLRQTLELAILTTAQVRNLSQINFQSKFKSKNIIDYK